MLFVDFDVTFFRLSVYKIRLLGVLLQFISQCQLNQTTCALGGLSYNSHVQLLTV